MSVALPPPTTKMGGKFMHYTTAVSSLALVLIVVGGVGAQPLPALEGCTLMNHFLAIRLHCDVPDTCHAGVELNVLTNITVPGSSDPLTCCVGGFLTLADSTDAIQTIVCPLSYACIENRVGENFDYTVVSLDGTKYPESDLCEAEKFQAPTYAITTGGCTDCTNATSTTESTTTTTTSVTTGTTEPITTTTQAGGADSPLHIFAVTFSCLAVAIILCS